MWMLVAVMCTFGGAKCNRVNVIDRNLNYQQCVDHRKFYRAIGMASVLNADGSSYDMYCEWAY